MELAVLPGFVPDVRLVPFSEKADVVEIVHLDDPRCREIERVGGKAAQLSRLAGLHVVPPGFALTAGAYLAQPERGRVSARLREGIAAAYTELARRTGVEQPNVAVRSSAIDEDGLNASFAGQHETFLNVVGVEAIVAAVEQCWASARTEQVLDYRRQHGLDVDDIRIAVLVQQLVPADVSGVAFSVNPVSGRPAEVVVSASYGLGESIVGGTTTPDHWVARKESGEIVEQQLGAKQRMTVVAPGGTKEVDVPRILRSMPSLTPEQVREIVALCAKLELALGLPVDVECAFAGGTLYLLQCRPITTLGALGALDSTPVDETVESVA